MRMLLLFLGTAVIFALSSCVEIIDDVTLNADGSGTFRYNVNLSASKVKINSILALDSLDGKRVPSLQEIQNKIHKVIDELKVQAGISNVTFTEDYDNYIFKLSCDFSSFETLQTAIREIVLLENGNRHVPELEDEWLSFSENKMVRSIPHITIKKSRETNKNDIELLKNGSYTSITRFSHEVDHFTNETGLLSKNKRAVMIRTDPYSLTENPNLLDNTIYLTETKD